MNTELELRLAEELEERTEFCDWISVCCSCCPTKATPTGCAALPQGSCSVTGTK
jgi:hypothetical protein